MFLIAGRTLPETLTQEEIDAGLLYPSRTRIRSSSAVVAARIAEKIFDLGLAGVDRPDDIDAFIAECTYTPKYEPLE